MDILINFDGIRWSITPDPAVARQGDLITWKFQAINLNLPLIRWTAFFAPKNSPFGSQGYQFTTTSSLAAGQHIGATGAMSVEGDPADYKYGVRADDSLTQIPLGEEDPVLRVLLNQTYRRAFATG